MVILLALQTLIASVADDGSEIKGDRNNDLLHEMLMISQSNSEYYIWSI